MRPKAVLLTTLALCAAGIWLRMLAAEPNFGTDFFPLYFAAKRVIAGSSPYGAAATAQLAAAWPEPFAAAGIAYPLPLILLVAPLTLMPFLLAATIWVLAGGAGAFGALRLQPGQRSLVLLPLLFLPFYRSVALGQATLIWFALAAGLVLGVRQRRPALVGVLGALLLLKPQNGLFFALGGLVWGARRQPRSLWWFAGASLLLWGGSLASQPGWFAAWLAQVRAYRAIVQPPSLLPGGLLLVLACWKLPWWALLAAAQVVLFPLSDLYSGLPLLLCWVAIGGPAALIGAGLSWSWALLGLPNTVTIFWLTIVAPLAAGALWHTWIGPYARRARSAPTAL